MDPICIYGSEKGPEAPDWFEWTAAYLTTIVPGPVGDWLQYLFTLGGLPSGPQRTEAFCSTEILTTAASQADWNLVTSGQIPAAILTGAWDRVVGDIKRQAWNYLCVCSPEPYTPPTGDHLWEQTFGPFPAGTMGTFTCTGMPPAAHIETIGYEDHSPVPNVAGGNYFDLLMDWVNGGSPFLRSVDLAAAAVYGWQPGDNQEIGAGATMGGTYHAAGGPLTFTIYMDGTPNAGPPYDPGTPEIPDYDPPDPNECTTEELCERLSRVYVQGFSTLIEVLRNQGLLGELGTKADALQESADSILVNLAGVTTVVLDVQEKVTTLGERVELARRDASYLRRVVGYETWVNLTPSASVTGEGEYEPDGTMIRALAIIDTVPDGIGSTGESVKAFYQLGYVQFRTASGWGKKHPIVSLVTAFDHLPPACFKLYYNLAPGVAVTFQGQAAIEDADAP